MEVCTMPCNVNMWRRIWALRQNQEEGHQDDRHTAGQTEGRGSENRLGGGGGREHANRHMSDYERWAKERLCQCHKPA